MNRIHAPHREADALTPTVQAWTRPVHCRLALSERGAGLSAPRSAASSAHAHAQAHAHRQVSQRHCLALSGTHGATRSPTCTLAVQDRHCRSLQQEQTQAESRCKAVRGSQAGSRARKSLRNATRHEEYADRSPKRRAKGVQVSGPLTMGSSYQSNLRVVG